MQQIYQKKKKEKRNSSLIDRQQNADPLQHNMSIKRTLHKG
jgi:hypothetical protein